MHPPGADVVLVRHGEVGTKSEQVRVTMERRLQENIEAVLADRGTAATVERQRTRLFVSPDGDDPEPVVDAVTDTFGVVSASPALSVPPTMEAIRQTLAETARAVYTGGSFAVRARRAGSREEHPFGSEDIEREGGSAVWAAAEREGIEPVVDLEDPDLVLFVECRPDQAYVFVEKRDGPGGLPLGTQEPLVALVSGGIDSPVAAYETMRRGCPVYPLYVDLGEYGGQDHRLRAEATVDTLGEYAPNFDTRLRIAPGGDAVDRLVRETTNTRMLALRRFIYRVAEAVAADLGAVGIVSGESIGQKSSQTSANLRATSAATDLPVHRPLVATDKTTITQRAREIGTFEEATIPVGCDRVAPDLPATGASLDAVRDSEPEDVSRLARESAAAVTLVSHPRQ